MHKNNLPDGTSTIATTWFTSNIVQNNVYQFYIILICALRGITSTSDDAKWAFWSDTVEH